MAKAGIKARLLTLDLDGHPHKAGTVVLADQHAYLVEDSGAFRRVQVVEQLKDGVRYRQIRAATKAEKKAQKRERAKARSETIAAALRVARRQTEPAHA